MNRVSVSNGHHRLGRVTPAATPLTVLVDRWVTDGIITAEQAALIRAEGVAGVVAPAPDSEPAEDRPHAATLAVEALGYLGGVIVLVGAIMVGALYWDELSTAARLALIGTAAGGLVAGGLLVPARLGEAGDRLRSVLWLASTGAFAGFMGVAAVDVLDLDDSAVGLAVAGTTAVWAGALWTLRHGFLQQAATAVLLMLTAATTIVQVFPDADSLPGLGVWGVAAAWLLLGWGGVLGPRAAVLPAAAAALVLGAMTTFPADAGVVLALATAAAVVVLAVAFRDLVLLVVGAAGSLLVLPQAVSLWFPDTLAAPLALLVVGAGMVLAALWVARRRTGSGPAGGRRDLAAGDRLVATYAACAVAAAVALAVVVIGLT
ncbi:DUF2157 domain-containing protein [Nocardioides sp. GY 10113]|uniref:DUF2157 domain-containing protein n=1 Tax=Nocardioides sp. GY 10113 TaxID=2569761 RepID=UPI00145856FD|nr:DUF2157 domain-containing protein [Nocardioides sp. GY 10113]